MKLFKIIHNFFFCLKYPFWRATNVWSDKFLGYSFTWYDDIPEGWRKAFGKQLSEEIKKAGKEHLKSHKDQKWEDILYWEQIKEKYGTLRLYAAAIEPIQNILAKYECLSRCYCINCGKPARYITRGWVEYVCEDCAKSHSADNLKRLSLEDIPLSSFTDYKIMSIQSFKTKKLRDESYDKLIETDKLPAADGSRIVHVKNDEGRKYFIKTLLATTKEVNLGEKFNIDFEKF